MIKKKDARILFNVNDQAKITKLIVAIFSEEEDPQYLYDIYKRDFGNCHSSWMKWDPVYVLLQLYDVYGFANHKVADDALLELSKIDFLQKPIESYIRKIHDE